MFGSGSLSVRLGGNYALALLAREHPGDYHREITSLFYAFVRNPSGAPVEAPLSADGLTPAAEFDNGWNEEGDDRQLRVREDIQAVMTAVGERSKAQIEIEKEKGHRLDFTDAYLKSVRLSGAVLDNVNLPNADLTNAVLIGANLKGANLKGVNFERANLPIADVQGVRLVEVNLTDASLLEANLTGTVMKRCKGLTQEQINEAVAELDNPPKLVDIVDANGEPLVWSGASPKG